MSQLNYQDFINEIRSMLLLTTGYDENRIYLKPKEDDPPTLDDRLFIELDRQEDDKEICSLHIVDLYTSYQSGISIQTIIGEITQELKQKENTKVIAKVKQLSSYEKIKESLFIRPLNYEKHQPELQDTIYRLNSDIALVLYVMASKTESGILSFKVPKQILSTWNLKEDAVFEAALLNTYFLSPPRIYQWEKLLINPNYAGENFMDLTTTFDMTQDSAGNCLSTTLKANGAIAIFLPGVAQRIRHLFGSNFYIVFTSIHEAMLHKEGTITPEEMKFLLENTIRESTTEEDILSYNIYYCDGQTISII